MTCDSATNTKKWRLINDVTQSCGVRVYTQSLKGLTSYGLTEKSPVLICCERR